MSTVDVINTLAPKNSGAFALADSIHIRGGHHEVADTTARDAITTDRRRHGMLVFTQGDGKTWQLESDLTSWTEIVFGTSAGDVQGPGSSTANAVARFSGTLGKTIKNSTVTIDDSGNIATSGTVDGRDVSADGVLLDAQLPSSGEKAALAGTSGTPGSGNKYVTDGDSRNTNSRTPTAHATSHQNGGSDEIATATAAANAIPKAGSGGKLAVGWLPVGTASSTVAAGDDGRFPTTDEKAAFAAGSPSAGNPFITDSDSRLSNSRTPTAHAASHKDGGSDEISTATAAANAIPKAGGAGTLAIGWIPTGTTGTTVALGNDSRFPTAGEKAALAGTGTPGSGNKYVTADYSLLPTSDEKAALAGSSDTPNAGNPFVTSSDSRMTNSRAPNGSASGDLGGSYPSPTVTAVHETSGPTKLTIGIIADGDFVKRVGSTLIGGTPVGTGDVTGPGSATDNAIARFDSTTGKLIQNSTVTVDDSGNIATSGTVDGRDVSADGALLDARLPSAAEKSALAGTSGTPGSGNKFVTDADSRLTDSRAPTGAAGGYLGGTYPNPDVRALRETSGPTKLTIGAVADGQLLYRSGSTVIGGTYLQSEATADIILAVTTGGNDSDPARPTRIAAGDWSAYPFATIAAAKASLPISMGKFICTINVGAGNFAGFTIAGMGGPSLGLKLIGTWANVSPTTGSVTGTAGTGTTPLQIKRPTGSSAWTAHDTNLAGAFLLVTAGGGYVADPIYETAMPIEDNDADWLYLGAGGANGLDETTQFRIVYPATRINAVAAENYFGNTYGIAFLNNTIEIMVRRFKVDVGAAGAFFGIIGFHNGSVDVTGCELIGLYSGLAYGPAAAMSSIILRSGAYAQFYGIEEVTSYGVQCRNGTLDAFAFTAATIDYIYAKACTAGNAFKAQVGEKLTWGMTANTCTHTPAFIRTILRSELGAAGFAGANSGTAYALDIADGGIHSLQGATAAGSSGNQVFLDGIEISWSALSARGLTRRHSTMLQWGTGDEMLLHKLYIPVNPDSPGNEFSTDGTGYFGSKVKLAGALYAYGGNANGDISARVGVGTVTDVKLQTTRVTGFVGGSGVDHAKVKLPQSFVTTDTVGGARGFIINDTDYIIDLYPTQSDTNINQLGDNVPFSIAPRSWCFWWFLNQYDACVVMVPDTLQHMAGTLAISQGGTGATSATVAFDNLSPLTTKGDMLVHNGTHNIRFPIGSDGQIPIADSAQPSGWRWHDAGPIGPDRLVNSSTASADGNVCVYDGTGGTTIRSVPLYVDGNGRVTVATSIGDELTVQNQLVVGGTAKYYGNEVHLGPALSHINATTGGGLPANQCGLRTTIIDSATADNDSVQLALCITQGFVGELWNNTDYTIDVYPPTGGTVNNGATDVPFPIPPQCLATWISQSADDFSLAFSKKTTSGLGDVIGPASNVDNHVPRWNGNDDKTLQDSGIVITDNDEIYGNREKIEVVSTNTYVVDATDCGKTKRFTHASGCTVTLPNNLAVGFNVKFAAWDDTSPVICSPDTGATLVNRQTHDRSAGQYAVIGLEITQNSGTDAEWLLFGDTAA